MLKPGPHLAYILIFSIHLVFSRLLFLALSRCFRVLASKDIYIRIHHHFLTFFWVFASGPPTMASGPPSAKFCPLAQTSCYATAYEALFCLLFAGKSIDTRNKVYHFAMMQIFCDKKQKQNHRHHRLLTRIERSSFFQSLRSCQSRLTLYGFVPVNFYHCIR